MRVQIHDTIEGTFLLDVTRLLDDAPYTDRLTGTGESTITLRGNAQGEDLTGHEVWEKALTNGASVAIVAADNSVAFAGPIINRNYARESGQITLRCEQLRTLMPARMTFGVVNYQDGDLLIPPGTWAAAALAIIQRATAWGDIWRLPIDAPAQAPGGLFAADWRRYQILTIDDLITELEKTGAELAFRPYLTAENNLRYSTIVSGRIASGLTTVNVTATESPVKNFAWDENGSAQITGSFAGGNGTGLDMLTSWAGAMPGPRIPVRDSYKSASNVTDTDTLKAIADAALLKDRNAARQISLDLVLSEEFPLAYTTPSRELQLQVYDDPVLPDHDDLRVRVISLTGNATSSTVTPELQ